MSFIDMHCDTLTKLYNENMNEGRMSAMLTVEDGIVCKGDIDILNELYEDGIRMMTITWNYENELGFPNIDADRSRDFAKGNGCGLMTKDVLEFYKKPDTERGLKAKGIEFVKEMQRLGMIVDVSHMSDAGFYDVLDNIQKPFVASHSNARSISPWVRNLTDDMIKKLSERGGITSINFCADFLCEVPYGTVNRGNIMAVAKHIKHIADVGGIECIGFGTDFDGIDTNEAIKGVEKMDEIAEIKASNVLLGLE